ncbi:Hypothetical predicted protein [Podarcis lilfordi]|uniref:Uncharacterized protein n=1 Tax=Podarcis lilfordi TaxID=74358 RepID=A0AA35KWB3_9SAUR|nr:Hypothetical predicted protein [Podarcis lilfordi]
MECVTVAMAIKIHERADLTLSGQGHFISLECTMARGSSCPATREENIRCVYNKRYAFSKFPQRKENRGEKEQIFPRNRTCPR